MHVLHVTLDMLAHPFTLTHPFNLCTMASCLRCVQVRVVFVSDTRGRHWHLGGAALELPTGDIFIHGGNMVDNGREVRLGVRCVRGSRGCKR